MRSDQNIYLAIKDDAGVTEDVRVPRGLCSTFEEAQELWPVGSVVGIWISVRSPDEIEGQGGGMVGTVTSITLQ